MLKKTVIGVLLATVLAISLTSVAFAQETPPANQECCPCPNGPSYRPLDVIAETLGMAPDELRDALKGGQTVAQLADEQGVPLEDVANALLEPAIKRIEQAVADGHLSQEDADSRVAEMTQRLTKGLESGKLREVLATVSRLPAWFPKWPLEPLSTVLGMDRDVLRQALADGKSVAELAKEQGVPVNDVVEALMAPATERLQKAVADGRITQDQADQRLLQMADRMTKQLENGQGLGPVGQFFARHPRFFHQLRQRLPQRALRSPRWKPLAQ